MKDNQIEKIAKKLAKQIMKDKRGTKIIADYKGIRVCGQLHSILALYTQITRAIYKEIVDEDKQLIQQAYELAFKDDDELDEMLNEKIREACEMKACEEKMKEGEEDEL